MNVKKEDKYSEIATTLDALFSKHKFDTQSISNLKRCVDNWVTKNDSHMEFLGSNLTGVHEISFTVDDDDDLFIYIFKESRSVVQNEIYKVDGISSTWVYKSSAPYILLFYFMYRYLHSDLNDKKKIMAMELLYTLFSFKTLGSIYSWYFPTKVKKDVAISVYEELDMKFLLKKVKSWLALIEYRAKADFLPPDGYNLERLTRFTTLDCIYILEDSRNRYKSMMKNIYEVLIRVNEQNLKTHSQSSVILDNEGGRMRVVSERPDIILHTLHRLMITQSDFIDDGLIHLVANILVTLDKDLFKVILGKSMSILTMKENEDILEKDIKMSINYLNRRGIHNNYKTKMLEVIRFMKGYWSSGNIPDEGFSGLKERVMTLCVVKNHGVNRNNKANITIGLLIYLLVRPISGE